MRASTSSSHFSGAKEAGEVTTSPARAVINSPSSFSATTNDRATYWDGTRETDDVSSANSGDRRSARLAPNRLRDELFHAPQLYGHDSDNGNGDRAHVGSGSRCSHRREKMREALAGLRAS